MTETSVVRESIEAYLLIVHGDMICIRMHCWLLAGTPAAYVMLTRETVRMFGGIGNFSMEVIAPAPQLVATKNPMRRPSAAWRNHTSEQHQAADGSWKP